MSVMWRPALQRRVRRAGSIGRATAGVILVCCVLAPTAARADRSSAQGETGLYFEKSGRYAEAALYYMRALRGLQEVWIPQWYGGDASKAHPTMQQLVTEYQTRLRNCLQKAGLDQVQRERMDVLNEFWMDEFVDQELGDYKLAFAWRAEECEKHGDFLFAEELRVAAADYCRLVAVPYHERKASKLEARGQRVEAALHRKAAQDYKAKAVQHDAMARGDRTLAGITGLQSPGVPPPVQPNAFNSYQVYHQRVLSVKADRWLTGRTPEEVGAALKTSGLKHTVENARLAAVVVLANLGDRGSLRMALEDKSSRVRLAAAKALAATRWADGWAACQRSRDEAVREAVGPIVTPAGALVLSRAAAVTELLDGLDSTSTETSTFCRMALEGITCRQEKSADDWRRWWKGLGDARPGLVREGPDKTEVTDATVDLGTWWQSGERSIWGRPNPLMRYAFPVTVRWRGSVVVTQPGEYRFFVCSRGEKGLTLNPQEGSYFTSPCARLSIDGKAVLSNPAISVDDAKMHVRIDGSAPLTLEAGLHELLLEVDIKGAGTGMWQGASVRLYWSSEHFLREVIPAECLVTTGNK